MISGVTLIPPASRRQTPSGFPSPLPAAGPAVRRQPAQQRIPDAAGLEDLAENLDGADQVFNVECITKSPAIFSSDGPLVAASFQRAEFDKMKSCGSKFPTC